jgi:hypothetical protein
MAEEGLDLFYAERLWQLLPAVYRTTDGAEGSQEAGPLRELVLRLGRGIAESRRSIDALGRLGSIETADDWAIAYYADLLATRLVGSMDLRAQRLDVARTIYYRRRAGTVGLLELLASDVTGHDARAVEFFRRLGRSRHGFDPPVGGDRPVLEADRLVGRVTRTPAGGTADLRDAWGATAANGPFDEFAHHADFRRPRQSTGHYAIPRIGIFLWWLYAYPIRGATPVQRLGCPKDFGFDPTGRDTPLRAPGGRSRSTLGETWTSPEPWDVPIAISNLLWAAGPERFYPDALAVEWAGGGTPAPVLLTDLAVDCERGRFRFVNGAPTGEFLTDFHHGLAGPVGAQGQPDRLPPVPDEPPAPVVVTVATLGTALGLPGAKRTLLFDDSRTYPGPTGTVAVDPGGALVLRALSQRRPLLRWTAPAVLTVAGGDGDARLVIRGLHWQGADLRLTGRFQRVTIEQATIDPGSLDSAGAIATAIDGMALQPSAIVVAGEIEELVINRSIVGPVRTEAGGVVERLQITDSIVQSIVNGVPALATAGTGEADVVRSTILGRCLLHRLNASGAIFDDVADVEDAQHGCVRFTTYAKGSGLHSPYRSVGIPAGSAIFHSRRFGEAGYARLREDADRAIPFPSAGSIRAGAEDGSETGAFASERAALKARSLVIKLNEFMPIGTIPVLIDAD